MVIAACVFSLFNCLYCTISMAQSLAPLSTPQISLARITIMTPPSFLRPQGHRIQTKPESLPALSLPVVSEDRQKHWEAGERLSSFLAWPLLSLKQYPTVVKMTNWDIFPVSIAQGDTCFQFLRNQDYRDPCGSFLLFICSSGDQTKHRYVGIEYTLRQTSLCPLDLTVCVF